LWFLSKIKFNFLENEKINSSFCGSDRNVGYYPTGAVGGGNS
jgi:hypothetical protein